MTTLAMQLGGKSNQLILELVMENSKLFTEDVILHLFSLKNYSAIDLIFKNVEYPFINIDAISNKISALGDISLFESFYIKNKSKILETHSPDRISHGKYCDSFNFYFCAALEGHVEFIKYLLENTDIYPSCYNNEALSIAIRKEQQKVYDVLLNDQRVLSTFNVKELNYYDIPENTKNIIKNKLKIANF